MKKIVVTGGAGFIGSHLAEKLAGQNYHVTILDNLLTGKLKNIDELLSKKNVDFNQGIDVRLLTKDKMKKLGGIAVNPLRIAFDDIRLKETYEAKLKLAAETGIKFLSNYVLFNFKDTVVQTFGKELLDYATKRVPGKDKIGYDEIGQVVGV